MPAYNAEAFVARAIASALEQTEPRIEIIVVDDASTDSTAAIVERIAARDERVRLVRSEVNGGPGEARNLGLEVARGEWIALLDADDGFAPNRLETLIALGERHGADLVSDNLVLCPEDGSTDLGTMLPSRLLSRTTQLSAAEFVAGNIGSRHAPRVSFGFMQPIFRREFLERNGIRYQSNRFGEDFLIYLDCLLNGARWWVTPEPMYRYAVRAGSLTEVQTPADLLRIRQRETKLLREDAMVAADRDLASALRRHKAVIDRCYYYRAFTDAVKAGAFAEALRLLFETPSGFRHIVLESCTQVPTIGAKALRGGYRRDHRQPRNAVSAA
jgi:cellulose synthase/poly-beta-1,6-N-acetylglucosamine synthase-like glycosyltransferase